VHIFRIVFSSRLEAKPYRNNLFVVYLKRRKANFSSALDDLSKQGTDHNWPTTAIPFSCAPISPYARSYAYKLTAKQDLTEYMAKVERRATYLVAF